MSVSTSCLDSWERYDLCCLGVSSSAKGLPCEYRICQSELRVVFLIWSKSRLPRQWSLAVTLTFERIGIVSDLLLKSGGRGFRCLTALEAGGDRYLRMSVLSRMLGVWSVVLQGRRFRALLRTQEVDGRQLLWAPSRSATTSLYLPEQSILKSHRYALLICASCLDLGERPLCYSL